MGYSPFSTLLVLNLVYVLYSTSDCKESDVAEATACTHGVGGV